MYPNSTSLSGCLLRRGFLIERIGREVYLTDNAFLGRNVEYDNRRNTPCDASFLRILLEKIGCGKLEETGDSHLPYRISVPEQPLGHRQRALLFEERPIKVEAGYNKADAAARIFAAHPTAKKPPLVWLETHVALLVKGLNAVGCGTWSACEGHVDRGFLHVSLMPGLHSAWGEQLVQRARQDGVPLLHLAWQRESDDGAMLAATPGDSQGMPGDYRRMQWLSQVREEAILLGLYLYTNRRHLRAQRAEWHANHGPFMA